MKIFKDLFFENELISKIIFLETKITNAVQAGHKPHNEDCFQKDRKTLKDLRLLLILIEKFKDHNS